MIKVSEAFNTAFKSDAREIHARITIKTKNGTKIFTNNDLYTFEYNGGSLSGDSYGIGSTVANSLNFTLCSAVDGLSQMDEVQLEIGIKIDEGSIEYTNMGMFIISEYVDVDKNENKTSVECFDRMLLLEGNYKSKLKYPAQIADVALEIANLAGAEINKSSFSRLSKTTIKEIKGYSYRQALGFIAQFECGFVTFDRDGLLDIRQPANTNYKVTTSEYFMKGLRKNDLMYRLGGIRVTVPGTDNSESKTLKVGNAKGSQIILENPVMTENILKNIYQQIEHINYYPFTLDWRGNPSVEAGDWITMQDNKGNEFKSLNLTYKLSFSGGIKAVSSADTQVQSEVSHQFKGPMQQKLDKLTGLINDAGIAVNWGLDEPPNPKEGDIWFKKNGPDSEIWIFQDGSWKLELSNKLSEEIEKQINELDELSQVQKEKIEQSLKESQKAIEEAGFSKQSANEANKKAEQAIKEAGFSKGLSESTQKELINSQKELTIVKDSADKAIQDVEKALTDLNNMEIGRSNLIMHSFGDNLKTLSTWGDYGKLSLQTVDGTPCVRIESPDGENINKSLGVRINQGVEVKAGEKYQLSLGYQGFYGTNELDYCHLIYRGETTNQSVY